jgi:hypothetical protein
MKQADRESLWDVLAGSAALLAFVGHIAMERHYHGIDGLTLEDLELLSFFIAAWLGAGVIRWSGKVVLRRVTHIWMWLSLTMGLYARYWELSVNVLGKALTVGFICFVLLFGCWASFRASAGLWCRLRRLVAFVPGLIVLTPLLMGHWMDEPVVWLGRDSAKQSAPKATVVLLLDELNANASGGLQKILLDRGLQVNVKPVLPVHASTVEVVPALFTGLNFKGARACGLTRVCSNNSALDFAQMSVERNDVDVVGFHHQYCAMQGLRSCLFATSDLSIWQRYRWDCAALHRLGLQIERDEKACNLLVNEPWHRMREKVMDDLLNAPALQKGGVLFAHVPLPHPPAAGRGSLAVHYARNVQQAEQLLGKILDRLDVNKLEPRILIFSDHPLRPTMWCANRAALFDSPCKVTPELQDDHVPLIAAARSGLPAIEHVQSNQQVFDVLRDWLQH